MRKISYLFCSLFIILYACDTIDNSDTIDTDDNLLNNELSIVWKGSQTQAPTSPDSNWVYYNSTDKVSYIWNGVEWDTLSVSGTDGINGTNGTNGTNGVDGLDGISVVWKGELSVAPTNPEINWAYYDNALQASFIWDGSSWSIIAKDGINGTNGNNGTNGTNGTDGISIIWKGALTTAPTSPDTNWAYYNTSAATSYIWDGSQWTILAKDGLNGIDGKDGLSIIWKGSQATAPSSPDTNWAYFNSTDNISYIWNGVEWDTLSVSGTDGINGTNGTNGVDGLDGISVVWKGELSVAPTNPEINWAYYDNTLQASFIWDGSSWSIIAKDGINGTNGTNGNNGTNGTNGTDGISIIWKGALAMAPTSPDTNWAYYNTSAATSYIWDGSQWNILAKDGLDGIDGKDGLSIIWKGSLATAPASPDTNWAYFNNTDKVSYIWSGAEWDTLAISGIDGSDGTNGEDGLDGISITWKGELTSAPLNPETNWAYFNSVDEVSYIWNSTEWDTLAVGISKKVAPTIVILNNDTTIISGNTLLLKAVAIDPEDRSREIASSKGYIWAFNSDIFSDTTDIGEITYNFTDNGIFNIWVRAIDNDGLLSEPDVIVVTVVQEVATTARMKLIPAKYQTFNMGGNSTDATPIHPVGFTFDFWMDSTEVTQSAYDALMRDTDYGYPDYTSPTWVDTNGIGSNYPAYNVNWNDAVLYCNARSKAAGLDTVYIYESIIGIPGNDCDSLENITIDYSKNGFRLPTEAEWEFACRAGSTTDYFWGKDYNPYPANAVDSAEIKSYTVYGYYNKQSDPEYGSHEVASKLPNAFGLYDMTGNLWEWCNDWRDKYNNEVQTNPTGPLNNPGGMWQGRIIRGAGWRSTSLIFSHYRYSYNANRAFEEFGFRSVLPIK